jgi:hypothetical protein
MMKTDNVVWILTVILFAICFWMGVAAQALGITFVSFIGIVLSLYSLIS